MFFSLPFHLLAAVSALYLSWHEDPATTMTVQWHTDWQESQDSFAYRKSGDETWIGKTGTHVALDKGRINVHKASLRNLAPNAEYELKVGSDPAVYRFRTMPTTLERPLCFAIGGDLFHCRKIFSRMSKTLRAYPLDFAVIGGDAADAINTSLFRLRSSSFRRWVSFLEEWKTLFTAEDGRLIPFLIVPGSHDILSDDSNLFFSLFAFPSQRLYRSLDFGNYLSLFLLDSGHFHPIEGKQTEWLKTSLEERKSVPFRFAAYHIAAYPSHDPYDSPGPQQIRQHWCPLFDSYGLQAAFEHHNHACKRTVPLRGGEPDPQGVIYLGDGCWGASPRKTNGAWYLAKKAMRPSAWIVELSAEGAAFRAIDLVNATIDEARIPANADSVR